MPGFYERVAGSRVGPWADREATRSALEAAAREWRLVRQGQGEASVFQGVHCWVRLLGAGWLGVMPPWGVVCHAGQVAQRVWCVAPSLTLVLDHSYCF